MTKKSQQRVKKTLQCFEYNPFNKGEKYV